MSGMKLSGMKAICEYIGRSAPTVLKLVREEGFPARKIRGEWSSDSDLIDRWRVRKIASEDDECAA